MWGRGGHGEYLGELSRAFGGMSQSQHIQHPANSTLRWAPVTLRGPHSGESADGLQEICGVRAIFDVIPPISEQGADRSWTDEVREKFCAVGYKIANRTMAAE